MAKRADHNAHDDNDLPHPFDPSRARAKLAKGYVTGILSDFGRHRGRIFRKLRKERQQDYLKLVAALLPKEFRVREVELPDMTDEEFDFILNAARAAMAEEKKQGGGGGAGGQEPGGEGY